MKARYPVFVALVAVLAMASVAAAEPQAAKQRVVMNFKILPQGRFAFVPLQPGALKVDSGSITNVGQVLSATGAGRSVMRDGQRVTIHGPTIWTLEGKLGTLKIRERNEWVDAGNGDDGLAFGTWKFVSGTGQYARLAGGGRSGHIGLGQPWYARYEGFLTSP